MKGDGPLAGGHLMSNAKALLKNGATLAAALVMTGLFLSHQATAQSSSAAPAGRYALLCGDDPIPRDAPTIPWIGCFSLSAGHSATGTLANQKVEVSVDATGNEVFTVNGTVVTINRGSQPTNVSSVRPTGSGYAFCTDAAADNCPAGITVHSRNADKSVFFVVSECLPPRGREHVCVMKQKDWDFAKSGATAKSGELNQKTLNPNVPMPPGPYASWPADIRGPALQTVRFQCLFITGMSLAGPNVPKLSPEARRDVLAAVFSGCIANAMPDDWPDRAVTLEQERSHLEKAKDVWTASIDLDALAKQIGQVVKRPGH
jgi:hypothetical protein